MSIKIKILKEDKKRIDESLTDLLADGAMLAAIATALGVSVVMLKAALSGQKGDASMIAVQNVRIALPNWKQKWKQTAEIREEGILLWMALT